MPADLFSGLGLLAQVFIDIAEAIKRIKGTSKKRFAKELLRLFDILGEFEKYAVSACRNIKKLSRNPPQVKIIKSDDNAFNFEVMPEEIGQILSDLDAIEIACNRYLDWSRRNQAWQKTIGLFSPNTHEALLIVNAEETDCIIRSMPHSESGRCRTPNPGHAAH